MNKTNEVKFWLTIYSYFDVSMIMVIIIKKNKYLKKSHVISLDETLMEKWLSDLTGFTKLELNHFISNETFQHFIYLEELYISPIFFP